MQCAGMSSEAALPVETESDTKCMQLWALRRELARLLQILHDWCPSQNCLLQLGLTQILRRLATFQQHVDAAPSSGSSFSPPCLLESGSGQAGAGAGVSDVYVKAATWLSACWAHYGDLVRQQPADGSSGKSGELAAQWMGVLASSEATVNSGERSIEEVQGLRLHALTCLCLIIGQRDPTGKSSMLANAANGQAGPLMSALLGDHVDTQDLAAALLRHLLLPQAPQTSDAPLLAPAGHPAAGAGDALMPALMNLLDERDGISRAAGGLAADLVAATPTNMALQGVLSRLDASQTPEARRNAMDVISHLLPRCASADAGRRLPEAFVHELAHGLLARLGDEDLAARYQAAGLFRQLPAELVLPTLLEHVASHDGRLRSAAAAALTSTLEHGEPADSLSALMQHLRSAGVLRPEPAPGARGEAPPPTAGIEQPAGSRQAERTLDAVARVVQKWSAELEGAHAWHGLAGVVGGAVLKTPEDPGAVQLLSAAAPALAKTAAGVSRLLGLARHHLTLTGSVFQRLAPLLLLKVLPLSAFDNLEDQDLYATAAAAAPCSERTKTCCDESGPPASNDNRAEAVAAGGHRDGAGPGEEALGEPPGIALQLALRMVSGEDADEVRRLSAELAGRLSPQWALCQHWAACYRRV
ncbi:hypothetical protein CYMTET_22391 [Cymbomonas tetramitiformis]|uniref:Uncharacterized protein n=1 Tax=Cymbomonas tetramitiformis TaxID=36881 RepID=A0AAE0L214_9CHLO|nr:hypothetical protein CYMTET_22391 [Cymbomonas tetramitiformis]